MSGRAGRRGLDTKGNIIFYGDIDYLSLMKGELPKMKGNLRSIYDTYQVHPSSERLFQNMIHPERVVKKIPSFTIDPKNKSLVWTLRKYEGCPLFIQELTTLEKTLYSINEHDREEYLLKQLNILLQLDIIKLFKAKKITNHNEIHVLKEYMVVIMSIHNHLNYQRYMITMNVMKSIFLSLIRILYNYII